MGNEIVSPKPEDRRGAVIVNHLGILGLITTEQGDRGVTAHGKLLTQLHKKYTRLGKLSDWLSSGRPFAVWLKDRGYYTEVPDTTEHVFLARAKTMGVI